MKKIIVKLLFYCIVTINAQDKLITLSGAEYQGIYVGIKGDKVEFIQSGKTNSVLVPKESVKTVILNSGEIVDFSSINISTQITVPKDNQITVPKDNMISQTSGYNPCEDERYKQIKDKPLDDMSDREYNYFLRMDKECKEYQSKTQISTPMSVVRPITPSNQIGNISVFPNQTTESNINSNITEQMKLLASNDAIEDFKFKNPANKWMMSSFLMSALLSPLIGGTITIFMAELSMPDTDLSSMKTFELQKKYNYDSGAIFIYHGYYKQKILVLHKKAAREGAMSGCLGGWLLNYLLISSLYNAG